MINQAEQQKWAFLKEVPYRDAQHPLVRAVADGLWLASLNQPSRFAHLALAVARDHIRYELDTKRTGGEDIAGFTREPTPHDAIDALRRGRDDCDAKARLFVALCVARGLAARMVPHWKKDQLAHVSAEVELNGQWVHAEPTLTRARLGDTERDVPREHNGTLLHG